MVLAQTGADGALERLREAEDLPSRRTGTGVGTTIPNVLAQGHLALGRLDDARRLAGAALDVGAGATGSRAQSLRLLDDVAAGLAKVYRRAGPAVDHLEHFARATALFREMGMPCWLEKLEIGMRAPS